jgi:hypothetical protein
LTPETADVRKDANQFWEENPWQIIRQSSKDINKALNGARATSTLGRGLEL